MDPFATLGLPRRFELDQAELDQRYRELQKALHPDRFTSAPASERRMSLSRAVEVNEAYRVLRDELKRAEALLKLAGGGAESAADPEFLMEMMELREALGEAATERDLGRVQALTAQVQARQARAFDALRAAFLEIEQADDALRSRLAGRIGELRYYRRFLDHVRDIEEELGD
jgi:molecular chaperone HscB